VHVDDIARANVLAARSLATDVVLNIGSGEETSLLQLAELLAEEMGAGRLQPLHEEARAVNPVPKRQADISLAAGRIGYAPTVSLREGMRDLVAWWRAEKLGAARVPDEAA
jgi:UDP-glucose 4-epimerase